MSHPDPYDPESLPPSAPGCERCAFRQRRMDTPRTLSASQRVVAVLLGAWLASPLILGPLAAYLWSHR